MTTKILAPHMKAIVQDGYGSTDVLRLADVDRPPLAADEVLVRIRAASVNVLDWRTMRAAPVVLRFEHGWRRPRQPVPGSDAAGTVEAVGDDVTHLRSGDDVFGVGRGSFAEFTTGAVFRRKPANLSFEAAAAVPVAGTTALQALRDHGGISAGQRVLIEGAGGGVGTFAVQLAKAFGAHVTAATSAGKLDLVSSLGADEVIDRTRDDPLSGATRYDLVVDVGGHRSVAASRRAVAAGGALVLVGAGTGPGGPMARLVEGAVRARVLRQRVVAFVTTPSADDLATLADLIEAGHVSPVIDRAYPLDRAAAGVAYVESGRAAGKVVITV